MSILVLIFSLMGFGILCAGLLAGIFAIANVGEYQKKDEESKAG